MLRQHAANSKAQGIDGIGHEMARVVTGQKHPPHVTRRTSSYSGVCWLVHVGWNLHRRVLHPTWFSSTSKQSFRAGTQGLKSQLGLKVKHCQWQFGLLDWPGACWSKLSKCAASLWCWMELMRHFCSESIALHSNVRRHAACGFHASAMNTLKDSKYP